MLKRKRARVKALQKDTCGLSMITPMDYYGYTSNSSFLHSIFFCTIKRISRIHIESKHEIQFSNSIVQFIETISNCMYGHLVILYYIIMK